MQVQQGGGLGKGVATGETLMERLDATPASLASAVAATKGPYFWLCLEVPLVNFVEARKNLSPPVLLYFISGNLKKKCSPVVIYFYDNSISFRPGFSPILGLSLLCLLFVARLP